MARAQCLCGEVAFEVDPPLQFVHDCHCRRCQKSHGTGSATWAAVARESFRFLRGEERLIRYASSAQMLRGFCSICGSAIPIPGDEGPVFLPIGQLEGDFEAVSEGHIFAASKAPWHEIDDGLPAFDAFPPGVDMAVQPDPVCAPAGEGRVGGSCTCAGVAWELEGAPIVARRCHCMRCRRARSHSHAANALYPRDALRWTAGAERVVVYKLPEAKRFSQAFCPDCGAKVPWWVEGREAWNVPLGSLDGDPGTKPSEHIFVGSKAPWFEFHDELPRYEEFPD